MKDTRHIDDIGDHLPAESSALIVARIDERRCIGCTLCIAACPVDAIVGAAKLMHTVVAERCIGCELCLPPCPVDCIAMLATGREWRSIDASTARARFDLRKMRLATRPSHEPRQADAVAAVDPQKKRRQAAIAAALARARERRARAPRAPR